MCNQKYISDYLYIYIAMSPFSKKMPVINIYLSQELFDFIKKNKSKIVQQALQEYKEKQEKSEKKRCLTDCSA